MDDSTLEIILGVFGILLSIIGFFVALYLKKSMNSMDKLNDTSGELKVAVSSMKAQIIANEKMEELKESACKERHGKIDEKLQDHEKRIKVVEQKTGELDTTIKLMD